MIFEMAGKRRGVPVAHRKGGLLNAGMIRAQQFRGLVKPRLAQAGRYAQIGFVFEKPC